MTSTLRRHRTLPGGLTALLGMAFTLAFASTLSAQILSNPRIAEFDPSADHWQLLDSGESAVLRYELDVYLVGASAPFATLDMGKPSPDPDGKIRYDFASSVAGWPVTGGEYQALVKVVGPEGSAVSEPSNSFTFTSLACTISLSGSYAQIPASGGNYEVGVTTGTGCQWTATTALSFVTMWTAGGSGSGTAAFAVTANASSSSRTGTITIGEQTLTLQQDGAPAPPPPTTPVVTWAAPAPITEGTALGAAQLNATASVPGTWAYSPAAGTVLTTGTYTLSVTFTPADPTRYTTATASQTLVVNAPATTGKKPSPTASGRKPRK